MIVRIMEIEAGVFWKLARRHAALTIAFGPDTPKLAPVREDLEAVAVHSDWPRMRAAAARVLERACVRRAAA